MKVLYDHQIFSFQKYGGISRYFHELVKNFRIVKGVKIELSLVFSNNYYISENNKGKYINFFPNKNFRYKNQIISYINKIKTIKKLKKQKFDIFHPTFNDPYFLEYIGDKPFVFTVHDMINEKFPEMFPLDSATKNKKLLCEKASKIIAISQNTKQDIMDIFNIDKSKIDVVYHGNSMHVNNDFKLNINLPDKYILYVGSRDRYKNFEKFIVAIAKILNEEKEASVICGGGGEFTSYELELFYKLKIENRIIQFNVDDDVLAKLYSKATLFIFPSLYEGFGIPILEAFACKCPLACSNTSSLPEIAGDAAKYFDPYSEDSIYNVVKAVYKSDVVQESLIQKGLCRLEYFSWKRTIDETYKVYNSVSKLGIYEK
ncbi:MAG: glycosyltransferase [Helicobacteraceae bacterium]|nr:glycosyltransferase [Helicobacteraceae bacterium]